MKEDLKIKLDKQWGSRTGRAAAITRMCIQCIYDPEAQGSGSWRKQVTDCASKTCALYEFRPTSRVEIDNIDVDDDGMERDSTGKFLTK